MYPPDYNYCKLWLEVTSVCTYFLYCVIFIFTCTFLTKWTLLNTLPGWRQFLGMHEGSKQWTVDQPATWQRCARTCREPRQRPGLRVVPAVSWHSAATRSWSVSFASSSDTCPVPSGARQWPRPTSFSLLASFPSHRWSSATKNWTSSTKTSRNRCRARFRNHPRRTLAPHGGGILRRLCRSFCWRRFDRLLLRFRPRLFPRCFLCRLPVRCWRDNSSVPVCWRRCYVVIWAGWVCSSTSRPHRCELASWQSATATAWCAPARTAYCQTRSACRMPCRRSVRCTPRNSAAFGAWTQQGIQKINSIIRHTSRITSKHVPHKQDYNIKYAPKVVVIEVQKYVEM